MKFPALALLALVFSTPAFAQSKFQVFPQIADGRFSDGSYYRTTLMILPWGESDAPFCSLNLYGMEANINGFRSRIFSINIPAGGSYSQSTAGDQPFDSGYATLTCTDFVFANVLYTFYSPSGIKFAEATVFGTAESLRFRMVFDQSAGEHLGIAIANNTDIAHIFRVTVGTRTANIQVPARDSLARFVDEIVSGLPPRGILIIESPDLTNFAAVGLRFTGGVFTTIPAN